MSKRNPNSSSVAEYPAAPKCECGCGLAVEESQLNYGKWNRFVHGHQCRGRVLSAETRAKIGTARSKLTREKSPQWKGGRRVTSAGYIEVLRPEHPRAKGNGYVFEHIIVAEEALGRPLQPGEVVHHMDRNRQNNNSTNLQVMTIAEHSREHARKPTTFTQCCVCDKLFPTKKSHLFIRRTCSFGCAGELFREYYTGKPRDYHPTETDKQEALERVKYRRAHWQIG